LLKQIIQAENYASLPADVPTYVNIEAAASVYPSKKYCDLTGFMAPYTDPRTKLRFCNAEVYQFIHSYLTSEDVEKFLVLRNAQPKLK